MSYRIHRVDLQKDKNEAISFWKANFPNWPEEKYFWFYENNPYGDALCWLAKVKGENACVGSTALFPRRVCLNGRYITAAIAGDYAVAEKHRGFWPAWMLQRAALSELNNTQIDFLYASPNELAEHIMERAGYKIIGSSIRLVKVLRSVDYVQRLVKIQPVSKLLSKPVDIFLRSISREAYTRNTGKFDYEVLISFDKRFDVLWKEASPYYRIIGERSSRFLNWRFSQCPYLDYKAFALTQKKTNRILGYIVYQIVKKELQIADLFLIDMDELFDDLMAQFLRYQRNQGIDSVSIGYFGNESLVKQMERFSFSRREYHRSFAVYASKESANTFLLDRNNWYFMEADNDI